MNLSRRSAGGDAKLVPLRFLVLFVDGTQLVQQRDGVNPFPVVALVVSRYGKWRDGQRLLRDQVQGAVRT